MRLAAHIICVLLLVSCGRLPTAPPPPYSTTQTPSAASGVTAGSLTITVLDVGQGDAALVSTPSGRNILIDGGPPGAGKDIVLPFLKEHGISTLDGTIASHYDLDHIGGLPEVFDDHIPTTCWDRGDTVEDPTPSLKRYFELRVPCQKVLAAGEKIMLGDGVTITVLAINGAFEDGQTVQIDADDENAHSAALLITYGAFNYLTAGDLPGGGGDPPYTTVDMETPLSTLLPSINVLHISHHGSQTATNTALLTAAQPKAAIISVGNANPYGHPHRSVLNRLEHAAIPVYLTEHGDNDLPPSATVMNGPITITTTGDSFEIH